MLKLSNITKQYTLGGNTIEALRGVDLEFRENEFVSILGPSGCGKTTTLNIIGGLTLLYPGWATDIVGIVLVGGVVLFQRSGRKKLA